MITANYIISISEDYVKLIPSGKEQVPVFVNPGSTDFKQLYQSCKQSKNVDFLIRFIADLQKQKLYVWDGMWATHHTALTSLSLLSSDKSLVYGWGLLKSGSVIFDGMEHITEDIDELKSYIGLSRNTSDMEMKQDYGKDIAKTVSYLNFVFSFNWNWLERYVKGINGFVNTNKQSFIKWYESYGKRWSS